MSEGLRPARGLPWVLAGLALLAVLVPLPGSSGAWAGEVLEHLGYRVEIGDLASQAGGAEVGEALRRQIEICAAVDVPAGVQEFFRSVPVALVRTEPGDAGSPGTYHGKERRITLRPLPFAPDKPILLHELLHAYHAERLAEGVRNPDVLEFFRRAKAADGLYPPDSYMLTNVREYFAMTASAFLHGSVARDPFSRAALAAKQPNYFRWLEEEFGPR